MKSSGFLKGTVSTLVTRLLIMGLTSLTGVVAARALGPADLGAFTVALAVPMLFSLFLQFGVGIANVYYMGQKKYPAEVLLGNALTLSLITSAVTLPVYLALVPLLSRTVAIGIQPLALVIVGFSIPAALVGGHLSFIFLGLQDVEEYNWLRLIRNGGTLILLIMFILLFDLRVIGALLAVNLAWLAMVARGFWALRGRVKVRLAWDWEVLWDCLKLGVKGYLANLFQFFNYRLDVLLLSLFMGVGTVGLYATAVAAAEALWYLPEAVGTVLFPKIAFSTAEEASSFTPVVARLVFSLTLVLGLVLGVLSYPLVTWVFGADYAGSVPALRLLLPGAIALSLAKVLSSDLGGRGLLWYNTLAALSGLAATVVLDLLLIPRWGINGAAVASCVSYTLNTLVVLTLYLRVSGGQLTKLFIPARRDWNLCVATWHRGVNSFLR